MTVNGKKRGRSLFYTNIRLLTGDLRRLNIVTPAAVGMYGIVRTLSPLSDTRYGSLSGRSSHGTITTTIIIKTHHERCQ